MAAEITWTLSTSDSRIGTFAVGDKVFKINAQRRTTSRSNGHSARKISGHSWLVTIFNADGAEVFERLHVMSTAPVRNIKADVACVVASLNA